MIHQAKYEYYVHFWGQLMYFLENTNTDFRVPPADQWFDTKEERDVELDRMNKISDELKLILCNRTSEGYLTRYEHVIESIVEYNGKIYKVENNLGYGFYNDQELCPIGQYADYMKEWKWNIRDQLSNLLKENTYDTVNRLYTTLILR